MSQRSLSAVHVAEREYSRMADSRHFVSDDEKERRAVATIVMTLSIAHDATLLRILFFFLSFFLSSWNSPAFGWTEKDSRFAKRWTWRIRWPNMSSFAVHLASQHAVTRRRRVENYGGPSEEPRDYNLRSLRVKMWRNRRYIAVFAKSTVIVSRNRFRQSTGVQITPSFFLRAPITSQESVKRKFLFPYDPPTWLSARNATRAILICEPFISEFLTL